MRHLDDGAVDQLLRGVPDAVQHFREHLIKPCDACEEFLLQDRKLGLLDGQVETVLLALHPPAPKPLDEVGYARIRRRFKLRGALRVSLGAIAVAASLAWFSLVRPAPAPRFESEEDLKGALRLRVELSGAVQTRDGRLTRVSSGDEVSSSATLLLRYQATDAASALLIRERESAPEVLGSFRLEPGLHDLASASGLAGLSLEGEQGLVTFVLIARPGANVPSLGEVLPRLRSIGGQEEGWAVVRFTVQVASEHH